MTLSLTLRARGVAVLTAALLAAFGLAACSKAESPGGAGTGSSEGAQQVVESASGEECTLGKYGLEGLELGSGFVGFSQSEKEANPFRIAETKSIKDEAAKLGIELQATNAQSQFSKQISDVQQLIAQGAKALIIAPLNSDGWEPVLQQAAAKHIPIITIDRKINATPCKDYVTFIGSDFYKQGQRAADQMVKALNGQGKVAILLGQSGNNVTDERTRGFVDQIKAKAPGIEISAQQTANFVREQGQSVTEQILQSNPDIDGIYAENDEMALGAVTALKGAGKKPGEVKIVSIDGTRAAVQGIVDGWIYAVIESNPRFGPLAFETLQKFASGEGIPEKVTISDREYDASSAQEALSYAY